MPQHLTSSVAVASRYASCAGYEIHYMDWWPDHVDGGDTRALLQLPTVIAWHGLARTGRDMDALAHALVQQGFRVICPDTLGRGLSQWSRHPDTEYTLHFYAHLAAQLAQALQLEQVHWVGTSMGGAIGTVCAAGHAEPWWQGRIQTLVLNDNAPVLETTALERIKSYAGQPPAFDTQAQLEAFFRTAYAPYGWLSDAEWRKLTETSTRRLPDGRITPHYDPAMVRQFTQHADDYARWAEYDALRMPVLLLRGVESDLVTYATAAQMQKRGPGAAGLLEWIEVPGCGHAPALNVPAHFEAVLRHLRKVRA